MDSEKIPWKSPFEESPLTRNVVHIWRVDLDESLENVHTFFNTLSIDEQNRAGRFHFDKDKNRFVITRGILRSLLGHYLELSPAKVCLSYNSYGKPILDVPTANEPLCFNVSYSRGVAIFALTVNANIGVDVEFMEEKFPTSEVAERFFSRGESATVQGLPERQKTETFFRLWTQKEAYVKAVGKGLTHPLPEFGNSETASGLTLDLHAFHSFDHNGYFFGTFFPYQGYVSTIAINPTPQSIQFWDGAKLA